MKAQQLINELKFEEDPKNVSAQDIINASNIEDRRFQFYSHIYTL